MINITLTQFVNFVASQGLARVDTASTIQQQASLAYDIKKDFYKRIRENLVRFEDGELDLPQLQLLVSSATPKKRASYRALLRSYLRWRDQYSRVSRFGFDASYWEWGDLRVRVNPEVGLILDGHRTFVKLHFKKMPLSELRATIILHLMRSALRPVSTRVGLLEVRTGAFHVLEEINPSASILIEAEASAFITAWNLLRQRNIRLPSDDDDVL